MIVCIENAAQESLVNQFDQHVRASKSDRKWTIEFTGAPEALVVPDVERFLLVVVAGARLRVAGPLRVRAVLGAELCRFVSYFAQRQELLTAHLPVLDSAVANLRTLQE